MPTSQDFSDLPSIIVTSYTPVMQNIAAAIRLKDGVPGAISARAFAQRIRLIPDQIVGEDDRKIFSFPNFLTWAQEDAQKLIRLDGSSLYSAPSQEIFDLFKSGDWTAPLRLTLLTQRESPAGSGTIGALVNRAYDQTQLVGNKLYVGSSTAQTSILVIDTSNGRVREIAGLPSRIYNRFFVVGTRLFCGSTTASQSSIVWINTTNDVAAQVTMDANRTYSVFALLGTRLYVGGTTTVMAYIDTAPATPTAGTVTGLPSRTHDRLFVANNKLYVASSTASTTIAVITAAGAVSETVALPSRVYDVWFLFGTMLYASSSSAAASIIRIDTAAAANTILEITGGTGVNALPSRVYNLFATFGTRLYLGSSTTGDSIFRINNAGTTATNAVLGFLTVPNRGYTQFQRVGNSKIYLGSSTSANTLVWIDMEWDTVSEIASLPTGSRAFNILLLIETNDLWCLSTSASTNLLRVNTDTNTAVVAANGLPSITSQNRAHHIAVMGLGRLFLGSTFSSTGFSPSSSYIAVVDLGTGVYVQQIMMPVAATGVGGFNINADNRQVNVLVSANDKIYVLSSDARSDIVVLTPEIKPYSARPVYIKYGD